MIYHTGIYIPESERLEGDESMHILERCAVVHEHEPKEERHDRNEYEQKLQVMIVDRATRIPPHDYY